MLPHLTLIQAWWVLGLAILLEVAGSTCLRLSDGLSRLAPSLLIMVFYGLSFTLNTMVVRVLGLGLTYAVWSGLGTVLTSLIGWWWFDEPANALKVASIGLVLMGIAGLHASTSTT